MGRSFFVTNAELYRLQWERNDVIEFQGTTMP